MQLLPKLSRLSAIALNCVRTQSQRKTPFHVLSNRVFGSLFSYHPQLHAARLLSISRRQVTDRSNPDFARSAAAQAEVSEADFHKAADELLESISDSLDSIEDEVDFEEVTLAMGVLTIDLGPQGTFVVNKQTPNRQVWLSSPIRYPLLSYPLCIIYVQTY
mmetsp:Transcript_14403/g.36725  ORF Transcript_14403/g.36725 Transcript_14403/m.36725 type:complete len:161 (-) Transcript_14403:1621-2103(-)